MQSSNDDLSHRISIYSPERAKYHGFFKNKHNNCSKIGTGLLIFAVACLAVDYLIADTIKKNAASGKEDFNLHFYATLAIFLGCFSGAAGACVKFINMCNDNKYDTDETEVTLKIKYPRSP